MQPKHNKALIPMAKLLRRNMTKEERHLWYDFLRQHPARFSRQKVLGRYIADFYSAKAQLVIELDGSQHYEEQNAEQDAARTAFLEGQLDDAGAVAQIDKDEGAHIAGFLCPAAYHHFPADHLRGDGAAVVGAFETFHGICHKFCTPFVLGNSAFSGGFLILPRKRNLIY